MTIDTDKAWDKLYTRLKDDQLLVPDERKTVKISFKWAAAIAILCICGAGFYYARINDRTAPPSFTIQNNDISNTLVSTLEDGSIVYLTNGSALTCPESFAPDKRIVALQGDALFDVRSSQERPFLVETETAIVEVLGTAFNIKSADKKSFTLSVQKGTVKVTLKTGGTPVFVQAGETVLMRNDQLQKMELTDQQQFDQYTQKMSFKDDRLGNIVRVINKMSDKPIAFADSTLVNREMTITFLNNTPADMVELLCLGMGLTYTDEGSIIIIDHDK